jgi:hypothetical protein
MNENPGLDLSSLLSGGASLIPGIGAIAGTAIGLASNAIRQRNESRRLKGIRDRRTKLMRTAQYEATANVDPYGIGNVTPYYNG